MELQEILPGVSLKVFVSPELWDTCPCLGKDKATSSWCTAWFGHGDTGFGTAEGTLGC